MAALATNLVASKHTQSLYILKELARMASLTTPHYRGCLLEVRLDVGLVNVYLAIDYDNLSP